MATPKGKRILYYKWHGCPFLQQTNLPPTSNCAVLDETLKYSRNANFWGAKEGHLDSPSLFVLVTAIQKLLPT